MQKPGKTHCLLISHARTRCSHKNLLLVHARPHCCQKSALIVKVKTSPSRERSRLAHARVLWLESLYYLTHLLLRSFVLRVAGGISRYASWELVDDIS